MRGPKIELGLFQRLPKGAVAGIIGGAVGSALVAIWREREHGADLAVLLLVLPLVLIGLGVLAWLVVLCTYRIRSRPLRFVFALCLSVMLAIGVSVGLMALLA